MNIPPKYEDVVAQLETERARVTDYIAQRAQTELKLEAALGREAALCKWQSEQSDKMDALREELGQCGSMAAMIEDKEWAEHAGSGPVSSRVESAFTQLHNELSEAQQRLTVAEHDLTRKSMRASMLDGLLRELVESLPAGHLQYELRLKLLAALKPAAEVGAYCTHPPGCKQCSWCGFKAESKLAAEGEGS